MSTTLVTNLYGVPQEVHSIVRYVEYETRATSEDEWERVRTADITLKWDPNFVLYGVRLEDLIIKANCDICDALPYGACDRHAK